MQLSSVSARKLHGSQQAVETTDNRLSNRIRTYEAQPSGAPNPLSVVGRGTNHEAFCELAVGSCWLSSLTPGLPALMYGNLLCCKS